MTEKSITWGKYLCAGPQCSQQQDTSNFNALFRRLEKSLKFLGLTPFSCSVAIQFIESRLQRGEYDKFRHVIAFLVDLLNQRNSGSTNTARKHTVESNKSDPTHEIRKDSGVDDADTSDKKNPSQMKCPQIVPGLRAYPFWDSAQFPWIQELESSYEDIKKEFLALRNLGFSNDGKISLAADNNSNGNRSGFQHYRSPIHDRGSTDSRETIDVRTKALKPKKDNLGMLATDSGDWNVCYFYLHGVDFTENLERCPHTAKAIRSVPRHYQHSMFSALAPSSHVIPHCGPTNKKLRCHLPIAVPSASEGIDQQLEKQLLTSGTIDSITGGWLKVGGQERWLKEGRCVVFDDSFEHEAANMSTSKPRIVLIIDFWHPDLSDEEVRFFQFINNAQIKAAKRISNLKSAADGSSGNDDTDLMGDFFHVIDKARDAGISEKDQTAIWG